jgi:Transcriptional regulator
MFDSYNNVQKAVFEATLQLITQKELQATSMSLISKESGVSMGSIYYYFKSKEEIINGLYLAIIKDCTKAVLRDFYKDSPIQIRFAQAWLYLIRFSMEHSEASRFIEQYSFSPYIDDETKRQSAEANWCGSLATLYKEAIQTGLFIDLDPQLMVQMHYGSVVYLLKAYFQNTLTVTDDVIHTVIQSCWNAACKQPAQL